MSQIIEEELPVFIALYTLEVLPSESGLSAEGLAEMIRSLLLPCFSLSYLDLYDQPNDPLKHVLARVDWYLDGDKGDPLAAFVSLISMLMGGKLGNGDELKTKMREILLPEIDKRLELAFRYEFAHEA